MKEFKKDTVNVRYTLDRQGCFVIEDYNHSKLFSNFFPGVAGVWGIPMWVFFVNRGQCISSFGIEGKDKSLLEFQAANKAYRLTSLQGFRTFLKVKSGNRTYHWEPFRSDYHENSYKVAQVMAFNSHDLTIVEKNKTLGLSVRVNYFTIPGEPFPALVRRVSIINDGRKNCQIEMIDGLPLIVPYGSKDWLLKNMSRTAEAWVKVNNVKNRAPYYRLNVEVSDTPDVKHITEGNFYFAFESAGSSAKLLAPLVDPVCVFGNSSSFINPHGFFFNKDFKVPAGQLTSNKTPAAMGYTKFSLGPRKTKDITALYGHALSEKQLGQIVKQAMAKNFIADKARENRELIMGIKNFAFTHSSSPEFDQYCGQNFLDNVLRGGLPVSLKTEDGVTAFNVFSRKHGDLERDYNYFVLSPTYFSQGNGNFRDVNQNRRNDVWFNSDVGKNSIISFLNLSQADGYNPLVVKGLAFTIQDKEKVDALIRGCFQEDSPELRELFLGNIYPGEILKSILQNGFKLKVSKQKFLERLLNVCHRHETSEHGEGFWSDHWTYNLDLIESYLALFPEGLQDLMLDQKVFSFYQNTHCVVPRDERYFLGKNGVRQLHSVKNVAKEMKGAGKGHKMRKSNGHGDVYYTHLIGKLLCLITNKAASFDPSGIGIEMEADKPNWYDALNGLPGLLGSSISETLELKRYCVFLLDVFKKLSLSSSKLQLFGELALFMDNLKELLALERDALLYWKKSNDIKEKYRARVQKGIEGWEEGVFVSEIEAFLNLVIAKVNVALEEARKMRKPMATYFYHEVTKYETLDKVGGELSNVCPVEFKCHALPLFLEGFVHALRVEKDIERARAVYQDLRKSPLFDKKLKMYKVNADLSGETEEIGRTRVFPRGWLENESIWLHMEYKYLLELLKLGLYREFYETAQDVLVPFQSPERYGRSPLENSSFIVSSAHEDPALHGQGFVARLSGSTAEFVHIGLLMNVGPRPFFVDSDGELVLSLAPALASWLFTKEASKVPYGGLYKKWQDISLPKNTYAFNLLGSILTVYHNPKRKDTFGETGCQIKAIHLTYPHRPQPVSITGSLIRGKYALDVRDRKVERIDVHFD